VLADSAGRVGGLFPPSGLGGFLPMDVATPIDLKALMVEREEGESGTFNILWQIARCVKQNRPYLYLGYWIAQSRKMAYKVGFQPMHGLIEGHWQPLPTAAHRDAAPEPVR
jgi:hypothetical protein